LRFSIAIRLLEQIERTPLDLLIDPPHILADDPQASQDRSPHQSQAAQDGQRPQRRTANRWNERLNQGGHGQDKAPRGQEEAEGHGQTQGHPREGKEGITGELEHLAQSILACTGDPAGGLIIHLSRGKAEPLDHAAQEAVRLAQPQQAIYCLA